jgi:hypothetical protein
MTLNLVLTSRHAAYLTGDFRLTYGSGRTVDDLLVQKIVPVVKLEWCALVSFCGVARTSQIDVGEWLVERSRPGVRRDGLDDFSDRLGDADRWLSAIQGDRRLTISVVGFHRRRPFAMCFSNYHDLDGRLFPSVSPSLKMFQVRPKTPAVRVMGDSAAVSADDRTTIRELLYRNQSAHVLDSSLVDALAEANRAAARRKTSISAACVVGRVLPSGDGHVRPFGIDPTQEYLPGFVRRALHSMGIVGFKMRMDEHGRALKPVWVQMAFKVQGAGKDAMAIEAHEVQNAESPIEGPKTIESSATFWKIAEAYEPRTVIFRRNQ